MKAWHLFIVTIAIAGLFFISGCGASPSAGQAKNGNIVQINYTGKLADGTIFDSSAGGEPLEFTLGNGQVIPGFEKAVVGMKPGEKKTITVSPDEAYGPHRDELTVEVPREMLASDVVPQVGMELQSNNNDGSIVVAIITKISEKTVTVDANHPLAGKDLTFEIELVNIR